MDIITKDEGAFKKMIRRHIGHWTVGHDQNSGEYIICNHYRGVTYVESCGNAGAGDVIPLPKGCHNPERLYLPIDSAKHNKYHLTINDL